MQQPKTNTKSTQQQEDICMVNVTMYQSVTVYVGERRCVNKIVSVGVPADVGDLFVLSNISVNNCLSNLAMKISLTSSLSYY